MKIRYQDSNGREVTRDAYYMFNRGNDRGRFGDNESSEARGHDSTRSDVTEVDVALHHASEKALLVSIDGDEAKAVWLPKSQIEITHTHNKIIGTQKNGRKGELNLATVTMPTWLAKKNGLI